MILPGLRLLDIIKKLPETFTVKTGRGGLHFYLLCKDLKDKVILEDPELKDIDGDPLHLGELQALGQQVVGPSSIHPNGNRYEIIKDLPIATITKDALLQNLSPLNQINTQEAEHKRRKSGRSSIGDSIPIESICWPKDIKERAGAEVRGSHPLHGSDSGKNFAVNTAKNCWHCFRHKTGGGPLEWIAVQKGIIRCEDAKPGCLEMSSKYDETLKAAKEMGIEIPTQTGPTLEDALLFIADRCDGASSTDGQGFSKHDAVFGKAMAAKVNSSKALNDDEYKHIYKMLSKYNTQLVEGDMDIRLIPKEQPIVEEEEISGPEVPPFEHDILDEAGKILDEGRGFEYVHQFGRRDTTAMKI